jgi:hypothetical protein
VEPEDTAWRLLDSVSEAVARADAKASFALSVQSAVLVTLGALTGSGVTFVHMRRGLVLAWLGVALLAVGVFCAAMVVRPDLRCGRQPQVEADEFVFFGHLRHWRPGELESRLRKGDALPELSRQLVILSALAWRKHQWVNWSFTLGTVGCVVVGLAAALG